MTHTTRASGVLAAAAVIAGFVGCQVERSRGEGDTIHPPGFADPEGADSHAGLLRRNGHDLAECRACHGDDYAGGAVQSSCLTAGCHTEGVESCGTCHLERPGSDAHPVHGESFVCTTCHVAHVDARSDDHPDGQVQVVQSGLALAGGAVATWDPGAATCQNHCHGERSPPWTDDGPLGCDGCHANPPEGHVRFVTSAGDCSVCHAGGERHLDGVLDVVEPPCSACHGDGPLGSPPGGLLGASSPDAVGAHARHLDPNLADRQGRVVECQACHVVPTASSDEGHVDASAPADVVLEEGTYRPSDRTCVVACHGGRDPGPVWSDDSGAARACDACHGMPPTSLAGGGSHPPVAPEPEACLTCHAFAPETHVNGRVEVATPAGCDGCHGSGPLGAPPPGLPDRLGLGGVGAHVRHLDATLQDRIGRVARCQDCHEVPETVEAEGHVDASAPADVRLWNGGTYDAGARTCVSGCHWGVEPGPAWDEEGGGARACDACHAMPPVTTRIGTPHPPSAPELEVCLGCHAFDPATHVDGQVDFSFRP